MHPSAVPRAVSAAFNDAQRSLATHARASRALVAAYDADPSAFLDAFLHALNRALVVFVREPAVERVAAFVATFAARRSGADGPACEGGGPSFSTLVLSYLLDQSAAASKAVRFRCCQILAAALAALPEHTDLDESVWDPLQAALMTRACDKIPRVRAAAATALCRLQSSGEPDDDPVAAVLVALLAADSSASVRKAALSVVAVNEATIPVIMRRTRDVKEDVRRAAYGTLAAKLHPEDLSIEERLALLQAGLKDRASGVRHVVAEQLLLGGWLDGACESNVFELVELIGGQGYEEDVLLALRVIFASPRREALIESIEIDINNLTSLDVLVLHAMSDVKASSYRIEDLIPSATVFADVLKFYSVNEFASRHLLAMTRRVDLADEAGRRAVEETLHMYFLASSEVSELVIPDAVAAMRLAMISEDAASRILVEIILNDVLHSVGEEQVESENQDDVTGEWVSMRALCIAKELLRHSSPMATAAETGNGLYLSLMQQVVLPRLTSPDGGQRHAALEALALFCLLDGSGLEARRHVPLFVQACRNDNEEIQALALHILADIFMVFDLSGDEVDNGGGFDIDNSDDDDFHSASGDSPGAREVSPVPAKPAATHASQVVALLCDYVTHADGTLRNAAAEALARLLFSRRVTPSAKLLSKLLLAYYNPINEDDVHMRQCLSVFFPAFAFSTPQHRLALEGSFTPTLRVLLDAPKKSPLSTVSQLAVAQFLLHLTNPSSVPLSTSRAPRSDAGADLTDKAASTHERIAESLFHQILDLDEDVEPEACRLFARIISSLRLVATVENADARGRLRKLSQSAIDNVQDRRSLVQLRKFYKHIQSLTKSALVNKDSGSDADDDRDVYPENANRDEDTREGEEGLKDFGPIESGELFEHTTSENVLEMKNGALPARTPERKQSSRKRSSQRIPSPLVQLSMNQNGRMAGDEKEHADRKDDGQENVPESSTVDLKPVTLSRPRRAARSRTSYVEEPVFDLESETDEDDSSYNGESDS